MVKKIVAVLVPYANDVARLINRRIIGDLGDSLVRRATEPAIVSLNVANNADLIVRTGETCM